MGNRIGTHRVYLKKYDFRGAVLDVLIGGTSIIDSKEGLSRFPLKNLSDVDQFVRSYGYDFSNPIEAAESYGNFHEALDFIRKNFLYPDQAEGLRLEIPKKILELTDVRDLLLMATQHLPGQQNDTQGNLLRDWACAILKVIHTISHLDKDVRTTYFADVQRQIFDRFYKVVHRDGEGLLYLGEKPDDAMRVELSEFQTKPKKTRESMLLKLLHKPENVAEDIFDQVGIRFVTPTKLDALRVVKYLKDQMIVIPANIKPSRSRNTLINVEALRGGLDELMLKIENEQLHEAEIKSVIADWIQKPLGDSLSNPHSSEYYRSIQFTCRQLIKLVNPLYEDIKRMKAEAKKTEVPDSLRTLIEKVDPQHIQREVRFFYPYEVQVMDQESYHENEKGRSGHAEYKRAQLQTALRRVMGRLALEGAR